MWKKPIQVLLVACLALSGLAAAQPPPTDPCNFQSLAEAAIDGAPGRVDTYHFGQVTRFDCGANPRRFYMRAEVLKNNGLFWSGERVARRGVRAGQYFVAGRTFYSCTGAWVAATHTGYYLAGIPLPNNTDVTGPFFVNCPPPPPPICQKPYEDTETWVLPVTGAATPAVEQLTVPLTRYEERTEGSFLLEEWALVAGPASEPGTPMSSTRAFRDRVLESDLVGEHADASGGRWLVVEAPRHAMNARHIPLPTLVPFAAELSLPAGGEFWYRAEIGEDRAVDRVMILDATDTSARSAVREALRQGLSLTYADERRHRAVVFGVARVDGEGRLAVADGKVILPQCCCGEVFCQ